MDSPPMITNMDDVLSTIVESNNRPCEYFSNAIYINKEALMALMDDCYKKSEELTRCEIEKEMYKDEAKEANERLRSATDQLERLAKIFKEARSSICAEKGSCKCAYNEVILLRQMTQHGTMSGDYTGHERHLQMLTRAQEENCKHVRKIEMIEADILSLKDEINRVSKDISNARDAVAEKTPVNAPNKTECSVENNKLKSEIRDLSQQLKQAKEDVEKRRKDIELFRCLLTQIKNNPNNFSKMVTLD